MATGNGAENSPPNLDPPAASWIRDCGRAVSVVLGACALGLLANHFSAQPVPILSSNGPGALPKEAPRISAEKLRALLAKGRVMILDARSPSLLAEATISGAIQAQPETINQLLLLDEHHALLSAAEAIIVICDSAFCSTADRVAAKLNDLGFNNIQVLNGGWPAYKDAGLPMEPNRP